jgi:hypothetical protein
MFLGAEQGQRRARLREPVGVRERSVGEELKRPRDHGSGHLAPAVGERPEARERRLGCIAKHVRDAGEHRGHHEGVGDALGASGFEPALCVERGELHDPTPGVQRALQSRDPRDVVGRNAHQGGFVFPRRSELHGAEHVGDQVPLAKHGGLRRACRSAGEEQHCDLLRIHLPGGRQLASAAAASLVEEGASGHHPDAWPPRELGRARVGDHEESRRQALEQRVELGTRQPVVQRCERTPRPRRSEESDREGGAALIEERDMVGSRLPHPRRSPPGRGHELCGSEPILAAAERHAIRRARRSHLEQHHQVHAREGTRRRSEVEVCIVSSARARWTTRPRRGGCRA